MEWTLWICRLRRWFYYWKWTRAKISAILLIAVIILVPIFWFIPDDVYGHYVFNIETAYVGTRTVQFLGVPKVNYTIYAFFQTDGGFFPDNKIQYRAYVAVTSKGITNLTQYYCCLGFTGASYAVGTDPHLKLITSGYYRGYYFAEGTMSFFPNASTWPYLFPTPEYITNIPPHAITLQELPEIQKDAPAFIVGTAGDTLALNFDEFTVKLAFVFGSFSLLLAEPLLENVLVRKQRH